MKIQFSGANRTVTGSCHFIEVNGLRLLFDLGMYQGSRSLSRQLNEQIPQGLRDADAIILSHGHLDHCGRLPMAVRQGFKGPIYCTAGTAALARVVLEDAAQIQVEDASYLNKRMRAPEQEQIRPLFMPADVQPVMRAMKQVKYEQKVELGNDVSFTFYDAGHILGSAYVVLEWRGEDGKQYRLMFTGDIGRYCGPIVHCPCTISEPIDHVITESTYGDKVHAPMQGVEDQLLEIIEYCIAHKSRLVIPSFALGRTQTLLWYVQKFMHEKRIAPIATFVDSPMGVEITKIYRAFPEYYDQETRDLIGGKDLFDFSKVTLASSIQQSKAINSHAGPAVIIASSPTCEFGRVLHHLKISAEREDDVVLFVSWTPPQTLGRRLQDGQRRIRVYDRWYEVKCQVKTLHGLSAHADRDELLQFLHPALENRAQFYVVHGEADVSEAFGQQLIAHGAAGVTVPALETSAIMM